MRSKNLVSILFVLFIFVNSGCNEEQKKQSETAAVPEQQAGHPSWSAQSNIYEVNLRQYSVSGSIKEFEKHLPRLKEMGVEILWFMPITPIGKAGRKMTEKDMGSYYAVKNYKGFNEEFGSMDDWKNFVKSAQGMGFKIITDWVANHTAVDNHWLNAHPDFYVRDSAGKTVSPYDWTDVLKLNYRNRELRDSMIDAMKFWVTQTGIDGFRCDVAEDVPADFWKECIDSLRKIKNVFMLAEGEKADLHEAGFDETYTWDMMRAMTDLYAGKKSVEQFDSALNTSLAKFPANAYRMYFTTNHDENSWNGTEFQKYGAAYKTFAVFTQTIYQSVPLIYSGQEIANKKRLKFFVKDTIDWNNKYEMAPFYKTLLTLRKNNQALAADASFKKLVSSNDAAVFAYQREKGGHKVVVILNLSKQPQKFTVKDAAIDGEPLNIFMGMKEKINSSHEFSIEPWGYIVYDYQ
ncbi:MAG: alpha-amylase family glycosyl hydrolase [Ferruginibacter sp.]